MLKARHAEGQFWQIQRHLIDDEEKNYIYFRMDRYLFDYILSLIQKYITKKNTKFRPAISPIEKIAVTLKWKTNFSCKVHIYLNKNSNNESLLFINIIIVGCRYNTRRSCQYRTNRGAEGLRHWVLCSGCITRRIESWRTRITNIVPGCPLIHIPKPC